MPIAALNSALAGLQVSQQLLDVASENLANAQTPGYTEKTLPVRTNIAGSMVSVDTGLLTRSVNTTLQRDYWNATSQASYYDTQQTFLTNLQQMSGKPSDASSIASLMSTLSNDFTALSANPASGTAQQQLVNDASNFASGINKLASYVQQERNDAESQISQSVQTINDSLTQIAQLNTQIAQESYAGRSTANLEDQRDQAIQTLSEQMSISTYTRGDGVVVVQTPDGQLLADTVPQTVTFSATPQTYGTFYPTSANGVMVTNGTSAIDLAARQPGGKLGALLNLRDQILPQQQAQLDELSEQTASAFAANGLTLFTDAGGNVPANTPGSYVGFAQQIQVNGTVSSNPALVQQGTTGLTLQAGDNSVIQGVIDNVFQTAMTFHTTGLGPNGALSSGLPTTATLPSYASQIIGAQANLLSSVQGKSTADAQYRDALSTQLTNGSGVSLDTELAHMMEIQKSYGAAAQMMKTVNQLFDQLIQVVQ